MTIEDRKARNREELCRLILAAAEKIIIQEGLPKLSVRKIARDIEYSPAIIYHYFRDKEDIVNQVMAQRFQSILQSISKAENSSKDPREQLKNLSLAYIDTALSMGDAYLSAQLSDSPEILRFTACMFSGATDSNKALSTLSNALKRLPHNEKTPDETIEKDAQMIVCASIGFVMKLTKEKNLSLSQKEDLINYFSGTTVLRMAGGTNP